MSGATPLVGLRPTQAVLRNACRLVEDGKRPTHARVPRRDAGDKGACGESFGIDAFYGLVVELWLECPNGVLANVAAKEIDAEGAVLVT